MGVFADIIQSPLRGVLGFFGGLTDGVAGKVDKSERYSDGALPLMDPLDKSRAGKVLSDYAGWRGGKVTGEKYGKWGFAVGAGYMMGHFLFTALLPVVGFAAWPVFASCLLIGGAAIAGGMLGKPLGKHLGAVAGTVVGAVGGALVGTYNAVFKRGYYKESEPVPAPQGEIPGEPAPGRPPSPGIAPVAQSVSQAAVPGGYVERLQQERQIPPRQAASGQAPVAARS